MNETVRKRIAEDSRSHLIRVGVAENFVSSIKVPTDRGPRQRVVPRVGGRHTNFPRGESHHHYEYDRRCFEEH